MRKLESFKGSIFKKEQMVKIHGGMEDASISAADDAPTKTRCDGTTTTVNGQTVLDCGDNDKVD